MKYEIFYDMGEAFNAAFNSTTGNIEVYFQLNIYLKNLNSHDLYYIYYNFFLENKTGELNNFFEFFTDNLTNTEDENYVAAHRKIAKNNMYIHSIPKCSNLTEELIKIVSDISNSENLNTFLNKITNISKEEVEKFKQNYESFVKEFLLDEVNLKQVLETGVDETQEFADLEKLIEIHQQINKINLMRRIKDDLSDNICCEDQNIQKI